MLISLIIHIKKRKENMKILSIFLTSMFLVIITSSLGWTQIINKTMLNIDSAKASIAGPNNIYVTHVRYGDELFSVLLKINKENSATIEKVFNQKHQRFYCLIVHIQFRVKYVHKKSLDKI